MATTRALPALATVFACCATLQASTIASTNTYIIHYEWTPGQFPPVETEIDCNKSDPNYVFCNPMYGEVVAAYGEAEASPMELYVAASAGAIYAGDGGISEPVARFDDMFSFTPDAGQNPATQIEYDVVSYASKWGDSGFAIAFNGEYVGIVGERFIRATYGGSPFALSALVTVQAQSQPEGAAKAFLQLLGVGMLDANGNPVSGSIDLLPDPVPTPEPSSAAPTCLGLLLYGYRRHRRHHARRRVDDLVVERAGRERRNRDGAVPIA